MTTHIVTRFSNRFSCTAVLLAALCSLALSARAAFIPEPATVFYGKVIGTGSALPFLATEGAMVWTIRRADGTTLTLSANLQSLNDGQFSYRLNVPHEALVSGVSNSFTTVALGSAPQTQTHLQITVNSLLAHIIGPNGNTFDVAQALRSSTYRLDLQVPLNAPDGDGNGLPDWWETKYGLVDPNGDPDGDGLNNLAEYRNGTNPNHDDRVPSLATREIRAYADGVTVVLLRAIDVDSVPTNLIYTVTELPASGTLYLRNSGGAANHETPIAVGATFSQADVLASRVVFVHAHGDAITPTRFGVVLSDENASHPGSTNRVLVNFYRPVRSVLLADVVGSNTTVCALADVPAFGSDEQPYVSAYTLSRDLNYAVVDASADVGTLAISTPSSSNTTSQYTNQYVPSFGRDRSHVFIGGPGADRITGGMETDVIIGGPGDDVLRGNGGADLFVLLGRNDGNDTIEDFNPAQDTIDISRALTGTSLSLSNYLQVTSTPSNSVLRINSDGTGAPFNTMALTLSGVSLSADDVFNLTASGRIVTGARAFGPRVSIVASQPNASENGPTSGAFTISRLGSVAQSITVNLQITGSAINGTDYQYVPAQITIPAGIRSLVVEIVPYADAITENTEIVDAVLLAGTGYDLGTNTHAQVSIADLMPEITIEALEPVAIKSDLTAGSFLVTRGGVIDRSVLVRLTVGGTATSGSDYTAVSTFVNFAPLQTTAVIPITPKSTAVLSNGVEFVQISLKTDPTYRLGNPTNARVLIVEQQLDLLTWRDRYFTGNTEDPTVFALRDTGGTGIRNFDRYAFGLNPTTPNPSRGAPLYRIRDDRMTVVFRRPASAVNVTYAVEVSDDLSTWNSGDEWWESYSAPESANDAEMIGFRTKQSVSQTPKLFMRVRAIYTP